MIHSNSPLSLQTMAEAEAAEKTLADVPERKGASCIEKTILIVIE